MICDGTVELLNTEQGDLSEKLLSRALGREEELFIVHSRIIAFQKVGQ